MDNLENFLKNNTLDGGFLQSIQWENFQKSLEKKTFRIESQDEFNALVLVYQLPIVGSYFFVPRGPSMKYQISKSKCQIFLSELVGRAKENNIGWIRIEPQREKDLEIIKKVIGDKYKVIKSKKNHQPDQTLMIDLRKAEEEILGAMKSKTRYNIRVSGKRGVKIFRSRDKKYFEEFYKLSQQTAKRDGIMIHPKIHYEKMLNTIGEENLEFFYAQYENKIISSIMVIFFGGVATYLHGASSDENRNVMANYGLQWEAIKEAKIRGCQKYDFGGTKITENNEKNSWAGITKFKWGFCPNNKPVNFPGCWDIVLDKKKYWLYRKIQFMKNFFRSSLLTETR